MICELQQADFARVAPIFPACKQYIPVHAVLDGNYPGRVFADSAVCPRSAYVWCYRQPAYVAGEPHNCAFIGSLRQHICTVILPDSVRMNSCSHQIYAPNSAAWMRVLAFVLDPFRPQVHFEHAYAFDADAFRRRRRPMVIPAQRRLDWIEMPAAPAGASAWLPANACFPQRLKFGFGLVTGNTIIAYAGCSGFLADAAFMVEVDTFDPEDRRNGYATLVSTALFDFCLEHGLTPVWETTESNIGSRRIAEKLGFVKCESYPVYSLAF